MMMELLLCLKFIISKRFFLFDELKDEKEIQVFQDSFRSMCVWDEFSLNSKEQTPSFETSVCAYVCLK